MWIIQATPLAFPQILDLTEKLSGALIALLFYIGLQRRWFVLGAEFEGMQHDRDWWRERYLEERARNAGRGG